MCPPGYHHHGFVATHALGRMMYGYTLLVPMNQRVLNKLSKEHNISGHKWFTTHRVLKSHRSKMSIMCVVLYVIICVPWITYDHLYYAPCLACWALFGLLVPTMCNRTSCAKCMSCHKAIVVITGRAHDNIYIYILCIICIYVNMYIYTIYIYYIYYIYIYIKS